VIDSLFAANIARRHGGAFYNEGSELALIASDLINNHAELQHGGAVYATHALSPASATSTTVVSDSRVAENQARGSGGAFFLQNGSRFEVSQSEIRDNLAETFNGGAVLANSGSAVELTDSIVSGNQAYGGGGAILADASSLSVVRSEFHHNRAMTANGGAIASRNASEAEIIDSSIVANAAKVSGGGIFSNLSTLQISGSEIRDNQALSGSGGGVENRGNINIVDSVFRENRAANNGGAIRSLGQTFEMTLTDSYLLGNEAGLDGGAFFNENQAAISGTQIEANVAGRHGGGILNNQAALQISGSEIRDNQALSGSGGGVENRGNLSIVDSLFQGNFAAGHGGAIRSLGSTRELTITNSQLLGNQSGLDGGALYNESQTTIIDTHFASNVAGRNGGGIFNNGATVEITSSIFSGNKAAKKVGLGTAIYSTLEGSLCIDGQTVISQNGVAVFEE
jgi:fibronectin-binding autotransporter adhesin